MADNKKTKPLHKTALFLEFDHDQVLELKRILFRHGLTAHQFFAYVIEQMTVCDPRLEEILQEATDYKKRKILDGQMDKVDPQTLYKMIEDEISQKQQQQHGTGSK